jgi:hypothetical protein
MTLERRIADLERTLAPALARETVAQKQARYRGYLDAAFGDDGKDYEPAAAAANGGR